MRFTTFAHIRDNVPTTYEGWGTFRAQFKLRVCTEKKDVPLYCPAEYVAGTPRRKDNVLHVSFGVIDIDEASEEQVYAVLEELQGYGIEIVAHSTHSHYIGMQKGLFKCRLIFRFDRPVEFDEWDRVWASMNAMVHGLADQQCRNPNAIYFFPSCPPGGAEDLAFVEVFNPDGLALCVDDLLACAPVDDVAKPSLVAPDPELLKRIESSVRFQLAQNLIDKYPPAIEGQHGDSRTLRAAMIGGDFALTDEEFWPLLLAYNQRCVPPWDDGTLQKKLENANRYRRQPRGWRLVEQSSTDAVDETHLKKLAAKLAAKQGQVGRRGRLLQKVLAGDPIGTEAIQVFETISDVLARHFPLSEPMQLAMLLEKSINATHLAGNRDVSVDLVQDRISKTQQDIQAKKAKEELKDKVRQGIVISDAFITIGQDKRTTPYTYEEMRGFTDSLDCENMEELERRWVVRFGKSVYFLIAGEYTRAYIDSEAMNMARVALAPTGISLDRVNQQGQVVPLSLTQLIDRYGVIASKVVVSLSSQKSYYDAPNKTLVEAPCPFREMEPEYSPLVDHWLSLLACDPHMHGKLLDWLACMPLLNRPNSCLFLYGEARTGKTLLPSAAARLWLDPYTGGNPTELEDVFADFNDKLSGCPLVFGDEYVPSDTRGEPRTDLLRKMIQEHARTFKRKFLPSATLLGAMRMVISANNPSILVNNNKALTNQDIAAINERFLCIHVKNGDARRFLDDVSQGRIPDVDESAMREFFSGDTIPKHIWWLHENRKVRYGSRLLVAGEEGSELEMQMVTGAGLRSEVCYWISNFILKDPEKGITGIAGKMPRVDTTRQGRPRLLLTADMLHRLWPQFVGPDVPKMGAIEKALGGVCGTQRVRKGKDTYREVTLMRVKYWAMVNGVCSAEAFDDGAHIHGLDPEPLPSHFNLGEYEDEEDGDAVDGG